MNPVSQEIRLMVNRLAVFSVRNSPIYKTMERARAALEAGDGSAAAESLKTAGETLANIRPRNKELFKNFVPSLGRLSEMGRKQMKSALDEALRDIPSDKEWRKPFQGAVEALESGKFEGGDPMPDLFEGAVTHVMEARKAVEADNMKKAGENVDAAMLLYRSAAPLVIRMQMTPVP